MGVGPPATAVNVAVKVTEPPSDGTVPLVTTLVGVALATVTVSLAEVSAAL